MYKFVTVATPTTEETASPSPPFNPNGRRYKLCCCHVKTFTVTFSIVEIFVICFLLIAVLPDISARLCNIVLDSELEQVIDDNYTISFTFDNITINSLFDLEGFQDAGCKINGFWFAWALIQLLTVNLTFYGCKNVRWKFLIPHLFFRLMCTLLLLFLLTLLIFSVVTYDDETAYNVFLIFLNVIGLLFVGLLVFVQVRCAEMLKKSADSGYSVTSTSNFAPPTISLSDRRQPDNAIVNREAKIDSIHQLNVISEEESPTPDEVPSLTHKKLPPLRHTYKP
ncbi:unnamed protein product [Bursaphelenchus okinawaensis]|uniref:Uncharacterized protein n=1 Tax=Bursaphelenchus okinawaensis TaxID=465554 RepID=A0A811LLW6_9BILA|nr:unnamed protein product [Bursaphelenchus okinawaensis]CAG9125768.1 unnamed protein product [Bursaphelenchus okinawaensis]